MLNQHPQLFVTINTPLLHVAFQSAVNQSIIQTDRHTHTHTYIHTYVHTNKQTNIKTISRSVTESSSSALIKYDIEKNVPLIKPSKIFWWFPS